MPGCTSTLLPIRIFNTMLSGTPDNWVRMFIIRHAMHALEIALTKISCFFGLDSGRASPGCSVVCRSPLRPTRSILIEATAASGRDRLRLKLYLISATIDVEGAMIFEDLGSG